MLTAKILPPFPFAFFLKIYLPFIKKLGIRYMINISTISGEKMSKFNPSVFALFYLAAHLFC